MRPIVITQTGIGTTAPVPLDRYISPFEVTLRCVVSGNPVYGVQYTYDDVFSVAPGSIDWLNSTAIPAGSTTSLQDNYDNPVSAVRINLTGVGAPTDSVKMTVNQAGIVG